MSIITIRVDDDAFRVFHRIDGGIDIIPNSTKRGIQYLENDEAYTSYYKKQAQLAKEIAVSAHEGQVDKSGIDYIQHPLTVASLCTHIEAIPIALLHDTLEDTNVTAKDLDEKGIDAEIIRVVEILTKESGTNFDEKRYFKKIKADYLATEVKICDLLHNMDLNRKPKIEPEKLQQLHVKYEAQLKYLLGYNNP